MKLISSLLITHPLAGKKAPVRVLPGIGVLLLSLAAVMSSQAIAGELLEPPMTNVEGSTGDAATNEGHSVSADGRYVVFTSYASNLVVNDSNGARDVFVWDTQLDSVELISRSAAGVQANGDSSDAVISADGQWVAFSSAASNLVGSGLEDSNGATEDVFLYSRVNDSLSLVSVNSAGVQSASESKRPDINANGRFVTFDSAGSLASGADGLTNHVFRHDAWANTTALISQTPTGVAANALSMDAQMSADGQRIVFVSMATNLVDTVTVGKESFLSDLNENSLTLLSLNANGEAGDGISYFPSISGDGRFAAFHTNASNLVANDRADVTDVVLRNIETGELELLSVSASGDAANDYNIHPSLSFDGARVVFATNASNLVAGDGTAAVDIVLADRAVGSLSLLSVRTDGQAANGDSAAPSISMDGRSVAFASRASNLSDNATAFSDALLAQLDDVAVSPVGLAAAVLPSSRSVALGGSLTAFASVVSTGIAGDCSVQLAPEVSGAVDVDLQVQATNPLTNETVGVAGAPFLVLPGAAQTLLLTLTPNEQLSAQELEFEFACSPGVAPVTQGTNTLLVSAEATQPADIVALVATLDNNGIVTLPAGGGSGFFTVASVNVGSSSDLMVRPVVQGLSLDGVSICQTNPLTSECLQAAAAEVTVSIDNGETPTFAVFLSNAVEVPFAPATNRVVVQFEDAANVVRGRTSVAVRSNQF